MDNIMLIVKGFIIGLGKIIPGVSGAVIAISLGVYVKALDSISNFFKDIIKNIKFLAMLAFGIILAIISSSNIISQLLSNYYLIIIMLFVGLIMGGLPSFYIRINIKKDYIYGILSFVLALLLGFLKTPTGDYVFSNNITSFILLIVVGLIEAITMIIPGISGTAIMLLLGVYRPLLKVFSTLFVKESFIYNITFLMPYLLGIGIGILILSKVLNYLFNKQSNKIYYTILGFSIASILLLLKTVLSVRFNMIELLIGGCLLIGGFVVSYKLDK